MSDYSYIHIALRGEVQGATRTIYSYPSLPTGTDPGWDTMMVEPGAAVKRFLNATDCYVMQSAPQGHYISLITRDSLSPERGYMMISLLIDDGCALTGRQVLGTFHQLKKALIEENRHTDEDVDAALAAAGVPLEPVVLEAWKYDASGQEPVAEAGYRTYISVQELESIFSFPAQPEYADYRCILIVSATTSLRPGVKMPRITTPIRKQYGVVCPEGVTASSRLVYDGDRLTLTYHKEGFNTHTENVVVGTPAAYTKYEGSTIMVRTAMQTGIRFFRRIPVRVTSVKGTPLNGYTISVNGHAVNTMLPYIDFSEQDLQPDAEVEIQAASNNYRPLKIKSPSAELLATEQLELQLQPVEQGVTLRLDFGDGRVFEQHISIEKNTPEYNRLHSGNFHGFRAHRQVTADHSEVYNVDVRITSRPVAPNFESAHHGNTMDTAGKAPKFENISDEAADEKPRIDTTLPTVDTTEEVCPSDEHDYRTPAYNTPDDEDDDDDSAETRPYKRKAMVWGGIFLCIVAVIAALLLFLPQETDGDLPEGEQTVVADELSQTGQEAEAVPVPMTPDEQADTDYLNNNPVWDLSRLRSPMGQALAKAVIDGDLSGLAGNDYFAVRGRCTNAQALEIVEMTWKAIGSPNERANARKLRGSVDRNNVNLRELVNSLAKSRPSESANERQRPQR